MIQRAWVSHMCDTYKLSARKATGDTVGGIILGYDDNDHDEDCSDDDDRGYATAIMLRYDV